MSTPKTEFSAAGQSDVQHHLHPYTQLRQFEQEGPLVIVRGEGVEVFDENGKAYIEGMAGLWCASLGFSEKRLAEAAYKQMNTLPYYHSFSGKVPGPVTELVAAMIKWAPVPMARVLFANSGSESNDTAFKLVRYYNNAKGRPLKKKIIARNKAYHGVTAAAASMSGLGTMHQNFDLPLPGIVRVGCPHFYQFGLPGETEAQFVDRLAQELEDTILREGPETVAAFIAEPVQGAGGVLIPASGYFARVQAILKKYDILFLVDEVITGFGRLGQNFGTQVFDLKPDMITVAKMLTSAYVPMSALYVSDEIYQNVGSYTLKCTDTHGTSATATMTVEPPCTIGASPTTIVPPEKSTLSWYCYPGIALDNSCSITPGLGGGHPASGTVQVAPIVATTYTLSCTANNGLGSLIPSSTVTVTMQAPQRIEGNP